ncbi:hypothetical protein GE09DRAFT_1235129, partial [Coniochaeta sp. 2T2.1]
MSSAAQRVRPRTASNVSGLSSRGRIAEAQQDFPPMEPDTPPRYMEPCAATASMLLYAQGNSIVCAHHDTLTIERRFSSHAEEVQILAVDTSSDLGKGRLVVSYDASQTAIVWDLMTGEEVARFVSYEHLTCAAWMRSGNVAFGNSQGSVILFEPTTSEHISARTLDQIAVTAIAPASDCRTFAIGYQNGSLLIATVQPRFTILHNLTTSRGPSPIVNLAWHASSARQKSDMLAVQTNDGDLRVWSVSKAYTPDDPAKVVRILKRTENYLAGPNWMGWSKNGRVIQFSESETVSWDVRTKHVTYDTIPTPDTIRGLAVYGPGASLFTLGANSTVQQYDLNAPAQMVANVQHPANLLPPSPPISLEEQKEGATASGNNSTSESDSMPIHITAEMSESEPEHTSPLARLVRAGREPEPTRDHYRATSPESNRSRSSVSMSSTSSRTPGHRNYPASVMSRGMTENTFISTGSSIRSSAQQPQYRERSHRDSYSTTSSVSMSSVSMTSSHRPSRHRPSRLRHEVPRSPEDAKAQDLFKFTRSRLTDVPYRQPYMSDNSRLTNDDLRRQMLSTIFGWNKEIEELIRDEISRHPAGSTSRMLLAKWLGDITEDVMAPTSEMTSADWMKLALLGMSGNSQQSQLGRAYIPKLLETGDLHTAVTMLIGYQDYNDAIEIYISHKRYMEALILTCLFFPGVWERQEQIIKKWGEWLVQHGQQQLAIRWQVLNRQTKDFACTGKESTEPWTSPSAAQITFPNIGASIPELLSPPLSPPHMNRGPQRSVAKSSSLKLITSFGDRSAKSKFFSGGDTATPIAAGPTPIAESAMRSAGGYEDPATAVLRPSNKSAFNTPASAVPRGGFNRARLPSIGEQPTDSRPTDLMMSEDPSEDDDGDSQFSLNMPDINRSKTASPQMMRTGKETHKDRFNRDPPPPSPSPQSLAALMAHNNKRNGSRNRIPGGLDLSLSSYDQQGGRGDITSPEPSAASSAAGARYHWPSRRRGPGSVASSVTSAASSVARSHRGRERGHHTGTTKTLDDYINNLDAANKNRARPSSRGRERESSRPRKPASRDVSATRGRASSRGMYTPKGGPKRSPTSPVPMSPEDLITLTTPKETGDEQMSGRLLIDIPRDEQDPPSTVKKASKYAGQRESSKSRTRDSSRARSKSGRDRSTSRRPPALDLRGRSNIREGSVTGSVRRSPTSPVPMSAAAADFGSESEDDYKRAVEAKEKFRSRRLTGRSSSRNPNDPASPTSVRSRTQSFASMDPGSPAQPRERSQSRASNSSRRMDLPMPTPQPMQLAGGSDFKSFKTERQLKKEAAARELEERRRSLATRALAPPILHPNELSPLPSSTFVPPKDLPMRSQTTSPGASRSMHVSRGPHIGLPATPKAMRLVLESNHKNEPVPPIPASFAQAASPQSYGPSPIRVSPKKASPVEPPSLAPLTLLPATVYTPPPPRSASAPPVEPMVPDILRSGSAMNTRGLQQQRQRKGSVGDNPIPPPQLGGRRPSYDASGMNKIPPPPPPAPAAMLKELQHLAMPPPPPPAPMPYTANKPVVYGGQTSGMIEIVMDDDAPAPVPVPVAAPVSDAHVPIIAPPAPPSSRNGHRRGRSSVDNSIAGRISRATERMRSASRSGRTTKSPESAVAPYESIPMPMPPPPQQQQQQMSFQARAEMARSPPPVLVPPPVQGEFRTGLHQSEMI